jgi:hypothetical protein
MPQTKSGNQASQFPIGKGVGQQYVPTVSPGAGVAAPSIAVPGASPLVINGVQIIINVRTMSGQDIVNAINQIPGVTASINGAGVIVVSGINSIDGDANLRAILGI